MDEFIKQLDKNLEYIKHETTEAEVILYVKSNRKGAECPYCGSESQKVHSKYERSFQDLPMFNKKTKLMINNRKMFCTNPKCTHKTFAERFDFLPYKGKCTKRLLNKIIDISLNMSSVEASNILRAGIAKVGKSTICNLLKKRYSEIQ